MFMIDMRVAHFSTHDPLSIERVGYLCLLVKPAYAQWSGLVVSRLIIRGY